MTHLSTRIDGSVRNLGVIFGDQLNVDGLEAQGLDKDRDAILMMEVAGESTSPPSHVQRTVLFLSGMRHFAAELQVSGWRVRYVHLGDRDNAQTFEGEIERAIEALTPESLSCVEPGSHDVLKRVRKACKDAGVDLGVVEDPHFLCTHSEFEMWAEGRKELTMEYFYRDQRKKLGVLMTSEGKPEGGAWNFDKENRKSFRSAPNPPPRTTSSPDEITRAVIDDVRRILPDLPGRLESFVWPVTRVQALEHLEAFIQDRLPSFGDHQDAMWTDEDTLFHAVISPAMNLKLLNPREVFEAAIVAHGDGHAPLNAVEGFVRQVIGWREFIRGVYWLEGEDYGGRNGLGQFGDLPEFYWTGDTDMACMKHALKSVHDLAYGHHIARLMVTGNFAMIAGIDPRTVNDWYLGMYADAVDWVTTPNTLGMAMHADHGVVGTKPYAASGKYIQRMSNYCKGCVYDVKQRTGDDACPFNTFYWDFLIRNEAKLAANHRMTMIMKNVERMPDETRVEITTSAKKLRDRFGVGEIEK